MVEDVKKIKQFCDENGFWIFEHNSNLIELRKYNENIEVNLKNKTITSILKSGSFIYRKAIISEEVLNFFKSLNYRLTKEHTELMRQEI